MKKIVIVIISLVMLLSFAMPLHAEDGSTPTREECNALAMAASRALQEWENARDHLLNNLQPVVNQKEDEAKQWEKEKTKSKKELDKCLAEEVAAIDAKIESIEKRVSELKEEIAQEKKNVDYWEKELDRLGSEIQQWAIEHDLFGMIAGEVHEEAAEKGIEALLKEGAKIAGKAAKMAGKAAKAVGPIAMAWDAISIGFTVRDRLAFETLIREADAAQKSRTNAHNKCREKERNIDDWNERLSKLKVEKKKACPSERKLLEEAEKQYNKVQGDLDRLTKQLEEQSRKVDELDKKRAEAWKKYREECSTEKWDLTVGASEGGKVIISLKEGTYQVSAGRTGVDQVKEGTEVTLTAVPDENYLWDGWRVGSYLPSIGWLHDPSVQGPGRENPITFVMIEHKSIIAYFAGGQPAPPPTDSSNWKLYVSVGPEGGGNVDPYAPHGALMYPNGSKVNIQAWPVANYELDHWDIQKLDADGNITESVAITPEEDTIPVKHTITMTSDVRVIAHFKHR